MTKLASMLERARESKGLSQNRAAKALKTSATTYRQWLRGQQPELQRFPVIAEFVGVDVGDIVVAILDEDKGVSLSSLQATAA